MNVILDKFDSGWVGLAIELKPSDVELLIQKLVQLKSRQLGHFHIRANEFDSVLGVADIEFSIAESTSEKFSIE